MSDWMLSKRFDRPEKLCDVSSSMAKATDGGLKFLLGLIQK